MSSSDLAQGTYVALSRVVRSLRQEVPASDIGPGGFSVLVTLGVADYQRPGELAALEGVTAASMTRMLNSLQSMGLVQRHPDPRDGRAQVVELTEAGREMLRSGREIRLNALRRRIGSLSEDDQRRLEDALPALEALAATRL